MPLSNGCVTGLHGLSNARRLLLEVQNLWSRQPEYERRKLGTAASALSEAIYILSDIEHGLDEKVLSDTTTITIGTNTKEIAL